MYLFRPTSELHVGLLEDRVVQLLGRQYPLCEKRRKMKLYTHNYVHSALNKSCDNRVKYYDRSCKKIRPTVNLGCRRSRVFTFTVIRLRGPKFTPRPGQKFENEHFCFRRTPAVVKACPPCRVRLIKTPLYKKNLISYPITYYYIIALY